MGAITVKPRRRDRARGAWMRIHVPCARKEAPRLLRRINEDRAEVVRARFPGRPALAATPPSWLEKREHAGRSIAGHTAAEMATLSGQSVSPKAPDVAGGCALMLSPSLRSDSAPAAIALSAWASSPEALPPASSGPILSRPANRRRLPMASATMAGASFRPGRRLARYLTTSAAAATTGRWTSTAFGVGVSRNSAVTYAALYRTVTLIAGVVAHLIAGGQPVGDRP